MVIQKKEILLFTVVIELQMVVSIHGQKLDYYLEFWQV